ncbi:MAG: hypothetical protein IPL79_01365 [Myxococcales bacterium]|nr:hypothetical protein [Myxococcales bacterium]
MNRARLFGGRPRELISHATMELPIEAPNDPFYGDIIMQALARDVAARPASIAQWMTAMSTTSGTNPGVST